MAILTILAILFLPLINTNVLPEVVGINPDLHWGFISDIATYTKFVLPVLIAEFIVIGIIGSLFLYTLKDKKKSK